MAEENAETGAGLGGGEQREGDMRAAQAAVRAAIEHAVSIQALDSETATQLSGEVEGPAEVYALDEWVQATPALAVQFCRFPGCFAPPRPASGPGKPPAYCQSVLDERGQPAHTAVRSMRMRHRLRSAGSGTTPPPEPGDQAGQRPVSWARTTVPEQVARVERLIADSQAMITRAVADLQATVVLLGDDEARAAELDSVHHDSAQAIEQAKGDTLAAEQSARQARASAERARTEQAEALTAAEDAQARAEQIEAEAAERTAAADQRVHDAEEARDQARQAQASAEHTAQEQTQAAETARRDAAEQIEQAQTDAREHEQRILAERDRVLAERQTERDHQLATVRTEADQRIRDAERATSRAEQAAEDARADRDRQTEQTTRLQSELEQLRQRTETDQQHHRTELHHLDTQLRQALEQTTAARVELATATAQLHAERTGHDRDHQAAQARLAEARAQARADTDQLRADHAHQLRDLRQAAEDRVSTLTHALELAHATTESYRTQPTHHAKVVADDPTGTSPAEDALAARPASSTTQPRQSTRRNSPKPPRTPS